MKKDEENKHIKNKLEQPMLISDEHLSVKEYIELSGYPLINFDMFLLEILNIAGNTLHIFNKNSCHRKLLLILNHVICSYSFPSRINFVKYADASPHTTGHLSS